MACCLENRRQLVANVVAVIMKTKTTANSVVIKRLSLNPVPELCERLNLNRRGNCRIPPFYLVGFKSGPVYYCEYHGDEANANPNRHRHIQFMWELERCRFVNLED